MVLAMTLKDMTKNRDRHNHEIEEKDKDILHQSLKLYIV